MAEQINTSDDKTMKTQCGSPCDVKEHNHSCTSELTQDTLTLAA
jgi:hypothetical protein